MQWSIDGKTRFAAYSINGPILSDLVSGKMGILIAYIVFFSLFRAQLGMQSHQMASLVTLIVSGTQLPLGRPYSVRCSLWTLCFGKSQFSKVNHRGACSKLIDDQRGSYGDEPLVPVSSSNFLNKLISTNPFPIPLDGASEQVLDRSSEDCHSRGFTYWEWDER